MALCRKSATAIQTLTAPTTASSAARIASARRNPPPATAPATASAAWPASALTATARSAPRDHTYMTSATFLDIWTPSPFTLSQISLFFSFPLLFGDPLPHPVRTSYKYGPQVDVYRGRQPSADVRRRHHRVGGAGQELYHEPHEGGGEQDPGMEGSFNEQS